MNFELLNPEIQDFINNHLDSDPIQLSLRTSPFRGAGMQEIAEQVRGKQKCRQKLPEWYRTKNIYYPPSLALEQCSSALTGVYKAALAKGDSLADLTGGAGVDSYYFSKSFREVTHVERSSHLSAVAAHNLPLLGAENVRFICGDGLAFVRKAPQNNPRPQSGAEAQSGVEMENDLGAQNERTAQNECTAQRDKPAQQSKFDCIYLDPSRRKGNKKVFLPEDYEPDFIPHLDFLTSAAGKVIIKTSPLIDLKYGLKAFKYVQEIHVVAVKNECKEILWILGKEPFADPAVTCAALREAALFENKTDTFVFTFSAEENAPPVHISAPLQYLYEPGAAILKAGAFRTLGTRFGLAKLHVNSHLYTSSELVADFPGRSFKIIECLSVREFGHRYKGAKVHLSTRNFPADTASLKKKYRITEGGEEYAFFSTGGKNTRIVMLCRKVEDTAK